MNSEMENGLKNGGNGTNLNGLTKKLQAEDSRNVRVFNTFRYLFLVLIVLYSLIFIINPDPDLEWHDRITGICYVAAFAILTWLFRKYYREYRSIDYAVPVAQMLETAAKRYSLKQRKSLVLIFPLALVDIGLTLSVSEHRVMFGPAGWILFIQLVYIVIIGIAFLAGVLIWRRRQKPLRDEALRLLGELRS